MPTSPELQARIDELNDPKLRAEILNSLELNHGAPKAYRVPDEGLFEVIVERHRLAKEQQSCMRKWQESEVIAFIEYFKTQAPDLYARYIHHEKDLRDKELRGVDEDELWFDDDLWWDIKRFAHKWIPDLEFVDSGELVSGVRGYAQAHLI